MTSECIRVKNKLQTILLTKTGWKDDLKLNCLILKRTHDDLWLMLVSKLMFKLQSARFS